MVTTDPLAWVRAEMDAAEKVAEAARGDSDGVWSVDGHPHYDGCRIEDERGDVVVYDEGVPTAEQANHMARHDPAAVLRRIAADRKLLDECEAAHDWDNWGASGLADSVIRGIAEGWGWTEETT